VERTNVAHPRLAPGPLPAPHLRTHISMVGEDVAPMLVEGEVAVVNRVAVPGADRRASPDDPELSRTAPGTGRTDPGGSHG